LYFCTFLKAELLELIVIFFFYCLFLGQEILNLAWNRIW